MADNSHPDRKKIVTIVVAVAVVGVVFAYVLPRIADYGEVWGVITSLSWWWILALVASAALCILSDAPPWMTVLPGLSYFHALRMDLAGSALSQVLPGGAAVNAATQFGMLRSWGFEGRPVVLGVTLTTLWNQFVTFGFPVIAIGALSLEGGREKILGPVALAGVLIVALLVAALVAILWSPAKAQEIGDHAAHLASRLKQIVHKPPVGWSGEDLVRFRAEAIDLLRDRWPALTITTLVDQLAVFLVLIVSLRALGVTRSEVDLVEAFAGWSLIRALGSIPLTPGGLGVEEVALSGALVGFGAHNAEAVAATLVYRFLTVVPSVLLGLASVATHNIHKPKPKPQPKADGGATADLSPEPERGHGGSSRARRGSRKATVRGTLVTSTMRVLDWIRKLHQRDDAKALERAEHMAVETPAEREISAGDFEGMKADLMAGEVMYEVGLGEAERLAEGE